MRLPCPVGHYGLLSICYSVEAWELRGLRHFLPPPVWTDVASCNIYTVPHCYRDRPACPSCGCGRERRR